MNGKIDTKALEKTITDSKWDKHDKFDYIKLIREYAIDD